jgi:hypothetical protein
VSDGPPPARRRARRSLLLAQLLAPLLVLPACQSAGAELSGLAAQPPLDYAVLVTGGAFLTGGDPGSDTFVVGRREGEPVTLAELLEVLRLGAVFQRIGVDRDDAHRHAIVPQLTRGAGGEPELLDFLQRARDDGYDLLLVVEQLQNGGIDEQGINGRWPITLATWFMLGVGMFIPDHTYESRAQLLVTVRDLQTGRVVLDPRLTAGPVDLSLVERGSFLGIVLSIIVPPFWVHDDRDSVRAGVGTTTVRRLLLQLARELKSTPTRQILRERTGAGISIAERRLRVDAAESLTTVRLRPAAGPLPAAAAQRFEQDLLASLKVHDGRFTYEAPLPPELAAGALQVLVGTLTGGVASATLQFAGGSAP